MRIQASLIFVGELNDFLTHSQSHQVVSITCQHDQTVKHLAESLGVPHTEIGAVYVQGQLVDMSHCPQQGEQIEIRPHTLPVTLPYGERFVLDGHLGRLAAYLRMLGYDCWYRNHVEDQTLAQVSAEELRVLLTRDRRLLMRKIITQGYCIRSLEPIAQILEVVRRFDLSEGQAPFQRCLRCNTPLQAVDKAEIIDRLQPLTRLYFEEFQRCPACNQVYWKGSHYEHMLELIDRVHGR